ncbi:MAG: hypothetical protein Q7T71_07050, partial [Herbiconiux sp.]|nr:hypothetical protein [Herbiconiux sp.]
MIAVVAILIATGGAPSAAVASAARPGIQVSADGLAFADEITRPLFSGLPVVVPGDRVVRTLWVRNGGSEAGVLRLSGTDAWSTDSAFARDLLVSADPDGSGPGDAVALGEVGACALIVSGPVLQPGQTLPIEITVAFSIDTPARTGVQASAGLDFVAAHPDPADGAPAGADCSGGTVVPGLP